MEEVHLLHLLEAAAALVEHAAPRRPRRISGELAALALATPVSASVTPGPAVTTATPTPRVIRA